MKPIVFDTRYAPRKAFFQVRDQIIDALTGSDAVYGDAFFSEAELMDMTKVSRTTIRKSLDLLVAEGWIERRAGVGTFVGARIKAPPAAKSALSAARTGARVAVVLHNLNSTHPDWFSRGVLSGMDDFAAAEGVTIEVLGNPVPSIDVCRITRRLEQSRPNAVVMLPASSSQALLAGAITAMDIPCFFCGAHFLYSGLPTVCEDGPQGIRLAVDYLVRRRKRKRVGLLLATLGADWVLERRRAFFEACARHRLAHDEGLLLWTPFSIQQEHLREQLAYANIFRNYLQRYRPDALILGCSGQHLKTIHHAMQKRWLRIPEDVELVAFDQDYAEQEFFLHRRIPTIEVPLAQQCQSILDMVRQLQNGAAFNMLPQLTRLPCRLVLPPG